MRPCHLTITAFGPFPDRQEIDFDSFSGQNIFLVSGPTGGGKTTVFDAICFALYGEASGARRQNENFKSDFAPDDATCSVEFSFTLRGKAFSILRSPRQTRLNRRGVYAVLPPKAELTLPCGDVIAGVKEVNARVVEILGLEAVQFKQTAMLAQGEFQRFLTAGSGEKQEIFRRIFDTGLFDLIAQKMADRAQMAQTELAHSRARLDLLARSLELSDPQWNELLSAPYPDYDAAARRLSALLEESAALSDSLAAKAAETERARALLSLEERRANNRRLEQLSQLRSRQAALAQNAPEYEALGHQLKELSAAAALEDSWSALSRAKRQAQQAKEEAQGAESALQEASDALKKLQSALPAEEQVVAQRRALIRQAEELARRQERAQSLAAARAELSARAAERDRCQKNLRAFLLLEQRAQLREDRSAMDELGRLLQSLSACEEHYQRLLQESRGAKAEYDDAHHRFFAQQAGLLAVSLSPGQPCPVCGSAEHPSPAPVPSSALSREELERLQSRAEALSTELSAQREAFGTAFGRWSLLRPGSPLESAPERWSWQVFREEEQALEEEKGLLQKQLFEVEAAFSALCPGQDPDDPRCRDKSSRTALSENISRTLSRLEQEMGELSGKIGQLLQDAPEEDGDASKAAQEAALALKAFENSLAASARELSSRRSAFDRAQETHRLAIQLWQQRGREAEELQTEFDRRLAQSALAQEDFFAALPRLSSLPQLQKSWKDYQNSLRDTAAAIEACAALLTGDSPADLKALEAQDAQYKAALDGFLQQNAALKARFAFQSGQLAQMRQELARAEVLEADNSRLSLLAGLTGGMNPRRLSFERYVLAFYFDNIIAAANLRLASMTGGRYSLQRKEEKEKFGRASGLDLVIADSYSGKLREVSTLSGGESFQTSLALALSLADVVQAYSGGVSIETMFIDEGFGSLDPQALESAVSVLMSLKNDGRLVGVISHVAELKEWIPAKIVVTAGRDGSRLSVASPS
ncbi:MAG: SMC family ATPase [Oscillospiraceae bacterium]|nr:SMC family ATPase [Oscillospiraceae bacterium]